MSSAAELRTKNMKEAKTGPMDFDPGRYPHSFYREVYLCETDACGHTNNVSFVAYMENVRFDVFKKLELFDPRDVLSLNLILARIECNYRKIVRYNDKLIIYTRVAEIRASSFVLEHVFVREEDGAIVATGKAVLVVLDRETNHPQQLSEEMIAKLKKLDMQVKEKGKK
jgi:acyl-CoA thioester hydrolase